MRDRYTLSAESIAAREAARADGADMYRDGVPCARGHVADRYVKNDWCVECASAWHSERYSMLTREQKDARNARFRANRRRNPAAHTIISLKRRARENGMEFALTKADIVFPERCECCGQIMEIGTTPNGGPTRNSPSVDRIDSSRGYVPGNIAFICHRCNVLKKDGTIAEFEQILAYMKEKLSRQETRLNVVSFTGKVS